MDRVWIDDAAVTGLGPRLRSVNLTKLLVTNLPGDESRGLDGRDACPSYQPPLVAVKPFGWPASPVALAAAVSPSAPADGRPPSDSPGPTPCYFMLRHPKASGECL